MRAEVKAYDRYAQRWHKERSSEENFYHKCLEVPNFRRLLPSLKGKKLLDIGCGSGENCIYYVDKGAKVIGIDQSKRLIEISKNKFPKAKFFVIDMERMNFSKNSFDVITSSLAVHYAKSLPRFFRSVSNILKKGGYFIFSLENPVVEGRERFVSKNKKYVLMGSVKNMSTGKKKWYGKYFEEGTRTSDWKEGFVIKFYHYTMQTYIQSLLKAGFEIIDYIDCRPISKGKRVNKEIYNATMKIPLFSIFKVRKK